MRRSLRSCAILLLAIPTIGRAEMTTFTQTVVADFEFSILGGTPLNTGPTTPFIPFQAKGDLTFTLDPSINDPSLPTTVPFTNFTGVLTGVSPPPFLPFTISPNVTFLGGELTDIVRDANGDVISANIDNLNAEWELLGTPFNIRLFGKVGLPFSGAITSIPFAYGTVLAGAADFDVYLDTGGNDPLVAIGRNRTLTAVPEPASAALLGLGVVALGVLARRRRRLV